MNISSSKPRPATVIKKQLDELRYVIEAAPVDDEEPLDFSVKLTLASLKGHEEELMEELMAAELSESNSDLEIVLDGDSVSEGHAVHVDFLEKILKPLNDMWKKIAKNEGMTDSSGAVEGLMVRAFMPSSFAIRIVLPKIKPREPKLGSDPDVNPANQIFSEIFSNNTDVAEYHWKDPDLRKPYKELFSALTSKRSSLTVRTKILPYAIKYNEIGINERMEKIEQYEAIPVEGDLIMGDLKKKIFKIDAGLIFYQGGMIASALEDIKTMPLGSLVKAKILLPDGENVEKAIEDSKLSEGKQKRTISGKLMSLKLVRTAPQLPPPSELLELPEPPEHLQLPPPE